MQTIYILHKFDISYKYSCHIAKELPKNIKTENISIVASQTTAIQISWCNNPAHFLSPLFKLYHMKFAVNSSEVKQHNGRNYDFQQRIRIFEEEWGKDRSRFCISFEWLAVIYFLLNHLRLAEGLRLLVTPSTYLRIDS